MKSSLFSLITLSFLISCDNARQATDGTPAVVRQVFKATYPNTEVEWETENDGTYEAEFRLNGKKVSANYSETGELLETEVEVEKKRLPAAVLAAIAEQFPGQEIKKAERIFYPDGRIVYEAELAEDDEGKFDAIFSVNGTLIERTVLSDEEEKD